MAEGRRGFAKSLHYMRSVCIHIGNAFVWIGSQIWRWGVVAILAPALYCIGISAMYGDQYIVAACFYFAGISYVTAKILAWEETKSQPKGTRIGISAITLLISIGVLAVSLKWVQSRQVDVSVQNAARKTTVSVAGTATFRLKIQGTLLWQLPYDPQTTRARILVTIDNVGTASSVAKNWKLAALLPSGGMPISADYVYGPIPEAPGTGNLATDPLADKVANTPLTSQGEAEGELYFVFRNVKFTSLIRPDTVFDLSVHDSKGNRFSTSEKYGDMPRRETMQVPAVPTEAPSKAPIRTSKMQSSSAEERPDVGLRFVSALEPTLVIVNRSNVVAESIEWSVTLWNENQPEQRIPLPIPSSTFGFLRAKQESLPHKIFAPGASSIGPGTRLIGCAAVDCPQCVKRRTYIVYILWGSKGWFSEIEGEEAGRTFFPVDTPIRGMTMFFMALEQAVPEGSRIPIIER
jgi:hypothetical protein